MRHIETDNMESLCGWCFPSVAPAPLPQVQLEKDDKTKARDVMMNKLGKDGIIPYETADLDELIEARDVEDIDIDELIKNKEAVLEELDALIENTTSLVAKNCKLIKRCEKYRWGDSVKKVDFSFQRIVFKDVVVSSDDSDSGGKIVSFKTTPFRETSNCGVPDKIPIELTDIIVEKDGFAGLPDYELFLDRALLLHNDVLKPFLFMFRSHLERIQALYVGVDAWIRYPDANRFHLEQTFGIDFDIPLVQAVDDDEESSILQEADGEDSTSVVQEKTLGDTTKDGKVLGGDEGSDDDRPTTLEEKVGLKQYSKTIKVIVDKQVLMNQYPSGGAYALTFDMELTGQEQKLSQFLEFLTDF